MVEFEFRGEAAILVKELRRHLRGVFRSARASDQISTIFEKRETSRVEFTRIDLQANLRGGLPVRVKMHNEIVAELNRHCSGRVFQNLARESVDIAAWLDLEIGNGAVAEFGELVDGEFHVRRARVREPDYTVDGGAVFAIRSRINIARCVAVRFFQATEENEVRKIGGERRVARDGKLDRRRSIGRRSSEWASAPKRD